MHYTVMMFMYTTNTATSNVYYRFFTKAGVSHSQAAQALQVSSTVDPDDDSDTGSEDESAPAFTNPTEDEYIVRMCV